jgi:nucleotide-binding universal stress UspA family protein
MTTKLEGAVVVGVAESVFKGWALRWAAEQARLEGRPLALVNASGPVSGAWREHGLDAVPVPPSNLRRHGAQLLDRARAVVEQSSPRSEVTEHFEITDPSTLLIQASSTAHMVVLGSRGRGPVRSHLLGSVGLAVVRLARCPVVVHRPGDHPGLVHRGILVAADATEESVPVLAFAFREASLRNLPLKVVHYVADVRPTLVGAPAAASPDEGTEASARALAESLSGYREDYPDVHLTVQTLAGTLPNSGVTQLSRETDLTVVGTHQRRLFERMMTGSVSESVLQHARGPVAVVPAART